MKTTLTIAALLSSFFLWNPVFAEDPKMEEFDEQQMKMHNDQMEEHMKNMEILMDKLHATNDPAEKRRLLDAHRKEMSKLMHSMRSSRDDMVMGMMSGGARHGEPMPEGEKRRQYMIEKRLDMMDHMMEMMMQRDKMMRHDEMMMDRH